MGVSSRSAQATAGKGLAQGPYVTARAGVEPTTLRLRVIASTNAPSRFLEASSFFSILPLVILSSWKWLLSHCYPGVSILGPEGRDPQILGRGVAGGRWSRGRVVKYYYILSCTGSMFESGYF